MTQVWSDDSIESKSDLLVLLALADWANDEGRCWPAIERLAKKSRCSLRSAQDTIRGLVESGKLEVDYQAGPKGVNIYIVYPSEQNKAQIGGGAEFAGGVQLAAEKVYEKPYKIPAQICTQTIMNRQEPPGTRKEKLKKRKISDIPFKKPTQEEVRSYMLEIHMDDVSEEFIEYYEAKGWMIGKKPMENWKLSVQTWKRNRKQTQQFQNPRANNDIHLFSEEEIERAQKRAGLPY